MTTFAMLAGLTAKGMVMYYGGGKAIIPMVARCRMRIAALTFTASTTGLRPGFSAAYFFQKCLLTFEFGDVFAKSKKNATVHFCSGIGYYANPKWRIRY